MCRTGSPTSPPPSGGPTGCQTCQRPSVPVELEAMSFQQVGGEDAEWADRTELLSRPGRRREFQPLHFHPTNLQLERRAEAVLHRAVQRLWPCPLCPAHQRVLQKCLQLLVCCQGARGGSGVRGQSGAEGWRGGGQLYVRRWAGQGGVDGQGADAGCNWGRMQTVPHCGGDLCSRKAHSRSQELEPMIDILSIHCIKGHMC